MNRLQKMKTVLFSKPVTGHWTDEPAAIQNKSIDEAIQKNVTLNAIQTIYDFACRKVDLTLTFNSSLLMDDLNLLSRPVSSVSFKAKSSDRKPHDVQFLFGVSTDIVMWTATLANSPSDFRAIISPVYTYATQTPTRVPLSDWNETTDGRPVGFQARSILGSRFIKMLENNWSNKTK